MDRIAGFYKEILDKLDSYCLVCDSKKRVIFANRALVEDRGGLRDDTTCHELLFYITDECPWCQQQRVLEGRAVQRDIFNPSDTAHYSLVVIPVPLENGTTGCLHILNRISEGDLERKKAERYARFLEQIIENAPIMIFGNKNGKICLFNEECQRVTGYSREEVLGKDLFDLFVTEEDMPRVRQHCKLVLSGGFEPGFEFSWRTKSGQLRRIMWNCMLLEDPNGEPIVFGMGVDVTEQRRLEQQFLQALASKGETILVTEDDPIVLETVSSLLESLGYKVFRAKNAQEAIEIAKLHAGTIQLLFTDVVLSEMNGKELYERIKEEIPGIKVLFTSGCTENIIARHGVLEHGVSFIQKPYELSTLAKVIREVLDGVVIS